MKKPEGNQSSCVKGGHGRDEALQCENEWEMGGGVGLKGVSGYNCLY